MLIQGLKTANAQAYYESLGCKTEAYEGRKSILSCLEKYWKAVNRTQGKDDAPSLAGFRAGLDEGLRSLV